MFGFLVGKGPQLLIEPPGPPLHRPPTPSLDRGPVQRRVRRALIATGKPVLSTSQIVEWSHPGPGTDWHFVTALAPARRYVVRSRQIQLSQPRRRTRAGVARKHRAACGRSRRTFLRF
jgi:hypothetical protein